MKTARQYLLKFAALAAMTFILSSCEYVGFGLEFGNSTNDYHETTGYLCSRPWVEEWYDDYGNLCYQELRFYSDNTGEDYMYTVDKYGYSRETRYTFAWDWYNAIYTSIRLSYGGRDFSYMDNISMGGNQLNCLLDGYPAYFRGR